MGSVLCFRLYQAVLTSRLPRVPGPPCPRPHSPAVVPARAPAASPQTGERLKLLLVLLSAAAQVTAAG